MTNSEKVKEFMEVFGQDVFTKPKFPDEETMELRYELINEELYEFGDAMFDAKGSIVDVADALSDLLYVVYGAGHAFGIDLDKCFEEVHNSNMSKLDENGKPINQLTDDSVENLLNQLKGEKIISKNALNKSNKRYKAWTGQDFGDFKSTYFEEDYPFLLYLLRKRCFKYFY